MHQLRNQAPERNRQDAAARDPAQHRTPIGSDTVSMSDKLCSNQTVNSSSKASEWKSARTFLTLNATLG